MSPASFTINGHFKKQQVTGVQRYALELIKEFDRLGIEYKTIESSWDVSSDSMRQLWMQTVMPLKISKQSLLWSPTNTGPVFHENQVVTLHDIADQLHPDWFSSKYVNWRKLILPNLLRKVKGIITVSEYSKKTILQKYPQAAAKIKVIHNGVRTEHFYPRSQNEISDVKNRYNLAKPFVITVGSLDPRKNINGLIKAWNSLPEYIRKELDLVIVGGPADKFSFQVEEECDSSIIFLGYVEYELLPSLYSASEFFIYPSLFEGFGLPILEAMACRTPVITSNTTSLGEIAQGYAHTLDPESPEEISESIQSFFRSKEIRNEFSAKGYEYAKSFTWANTAHKTLAFIEKINGKTARHLT